MGDRADTKSDEVLVRPKRLRVPSTSPVAVAQQRLVRAASTEVILRAGRVGEEWKIEEVSGAGKRYGWTGSSLSGAAVLELVTDEDRPRAQALLTGAGFAPSHPLRLRMVTRPSAVRLFDVTAILAPQDGNGTMVMLLLARDVDEECRLTVTAAENAGASDSAAQQRLLLESSVDVLFRLETAAGTDEWAVHRVSDPAAYGWPPDARGLRLTDLVHPDDVWSARRTLAALVAGEVSRRVNLRLRTGSGTYVWMAITAVAEPSPSGGPSTVHLLARDVSEQVEAQQRLADSERRFRVTQHRAPLPLLELSPVGRILSVNAAACAFFGRSALELLEEDFAELMHPDDVAQDADGLRRTLRGEAEAFRTTKRFVHPDGSIRWGDVSIGVVRNRSGDVERLVTQVLDVTDARQMAQELEHRSLHDTLTGLANRDLLLDHLEGAIRRKRRTADCVAVLFVDLDHFKLVNDTYGHAAGDLVLCTVAKRLRGVCRESDTVGRLGGDEMVVVAERLSGAQAAFDMADRLMEAVGEPMVIEGQVYVPSISVGLTTSESDDRSAAELLRDADNALYRAKERGRGRWESFDPTLRLQAGEKLAGETMLRSALSHENGFGLEAEFQPVVDLATGSLVGMEALARILRAGQRVLEPEAFIPIAENHGLILRLGTLMLTSALERVADSSAPASGMTQDPWWISVNVSPLELADPDYNRMLEHWLSAYGVDPARLVLEITERSLLSTSATSVQRLHQIADLGIRLALDDFGTGFASLRNLRDLPISFVKLDSSLIRRLESDPAERAMTAALADLTAQLGLVGIAEGVETPAQREILHGQGWALGQGFLFPAS